MARIRAGYLAEAGRMARATEVLLRRAQAEAGPAEALTAAIARLEQQQLLRAAGRIEPRKRFKGGALVRGTDDARAFIFIDESGKSLPDGAAFFALGAVAMTGAEIRRYRRRADRLKRAFFGRTDITFHEPSMRRREQMFYFAGDSRRQLEFDGALNRLLRGTDFTAFGVGIRKDAFSGFAQSGIDPYLPADMYAVAIQLLLERYLDYRAMTAGPRSLSRVVFEAQGMKEDAIHQREYADLLLHGTQWISASAFQQWLETGVEFRPKAGSDPTEIADMLSRDIFEWLQAGCQGLPGRWDLFSPKIYCRGDGEMGKFGVKVFPDTDIRDRILAHRRACGAA